MRVVVLGPFDNSSFGNSQFGLEILGLRIFGGKWKVEIDVYNLGWSVAVLKLVFSTPIATFNMVYLLHFPFEAYFLSGLGNSTTSDSLLDIPSYCHSVSELLCRTTHHMLVVPVQLDLFIF